MTEISKDTSTRTALMLFAKISGWIAFPVLMALLVGRWLDERFETTNIFFLGLTAIAFIVSLVGMVRESKKAMAKIETDFKNTQQK
mgnify:CR=1 FL=1